MRTASNLVQMFHSLTKGDSAWIACNGHGVLELRHSCDNGWTGRRESSPLYSYLMFTASYCGSISRW